MAEDPLEVRRRQLRRAWLVWTPLSLVAVAALVVEGAWWLLPVVAICAAVAVVFVWLTRGW